MTLDVHRQALAAIWRLAIEHANLCGYPTNDVRGPLDAATWALDEAEFTDVLESGHEVTFDCTQTITQFCRYAGLKDPNGLNYSRCGYTGTMLDNPELTHYTNPLAAQVGAIVIFGPGTGEHGAQVIEAGQDPLLGSHGEARNCGPVRLSVERTFHKPPVTFLSIAHLIP